MPACTLSTISAKPRYSLVRGPSAAVLIAALLGLSSSAGAQETDSPLAVQIKRAERILIVTPEKDEDKPGGEQFLVEINRVVRGSGKKGQLVRIANSGDEENHPRYKGGQQYVVLLTKNVNGKGWVNLTNVEIPIVDGQVTFAAGEQKQQVTLDEFDELVVQNEFSADALPRRTSPEGRWFLVMNREGMDFYVWLLDIAADKAGAYQAKLLEASRRVPASTLKDSKISDQDIELTFQASDGLYEFRGRLDQGKVLGGITVAGQLLMPTRLVPTDVSSLKQYEEPRSTIGYQDFVSAVSGDETYADLSNFVKRHPDSPLALDAYLTMVSKARENGVKRQDFETLAADFLEYAARWGSVFRVKSLVEMGVILSRSNYQPDLALEYLTTAEQALNAQTPEYWRFLVRSERGKRLLQGDKPEEGAALLNEIRTTTPFDADITLALARHAERQKEVDTAIDLYGELTVLPMMERMAVESQTQGDRRLPQNQYPSRVVSRLWKEKHGDTKGLQDYLNEIYEKRLHDAADARRPPRQATEGTRVVLCELFTGAECPPCVAADIATGLLETTYAQSEVIVLRYHQHIPAPDPLANEDAQARFDMYRGQGTPTLFVDGRMFPGGSGSMAEVSMIYKTLRSVVDPILTEKSDLKLELAADARDGKVSISAKATGLESFPKEMRLRMALAEDKITFTAGNGVRLHEMIVRAMPGGVPGVKPDKGQLTYQGEVDLAKLKAKLTKGLASIESEMQSEFEHKPMDFKAMHLVAFLQSEETGEVLQAASIAVSGNTAVAAEAGKAASEKPARSKAPSGKN